jgi:predicted dehydrogenase
MRIGLIGLGRIGSFHAETLAKLPSPCNRSQRRVHLAERRRSVPPNSTSYSA